MTRGAKRQGNPCKTCSATERYVNTGRCVACTKKDTRARYVPTGNPRGRRPLPIHERNLDPRQALTIRLSPDLYLKLADRARSEDRSMTRQLERDLRALYEI